MRKDWKQEVSPYAAPARQIDYSNLPPAYTLVGDGEPFYCETLNFIENLKKCGIPAKADVYPCNIHAFDMLKPKLEVSKQAVVKFLGEFAYAQEHYFVKQKDI